MRTPLSHMKHSLGAAIVTGLVCACGPQTPQWSPEANKPKVFTVSFRQAKPDPVYNRARWVHLPEIIPHREPDSSKSPLYLPVIHMQFKDLRAEEALRLIASTSQYSNYCNSTYASRMVSLNALGTIDELADLMATQLGAKAIVDHRSRHVSLVSTLPEVGEPEAPRFADSDTVLPQQVLGTEVSQP